jgi:hypothetical protein
MTRLHLPALVIALAAAACAPAPTLTPTIPSPATPLPPTQAGADIHAPEGWDTYRSDALGFGFAYPPPGTLAAGEGTTLATIDFALDLATNVVREVISVSGDAGADTCASPLAEGWTAEDLSPETVMLNGISFLMQTHSGVAAGTSTEWVAYSTERKGRCVSLGYELSTFDPANLDPTRFPTPPVSVDWQAKVQGFEAIVATFVWLR